MPQTKTTKKTASKPAAKTRAVTKKKSTARPAISAKRPAILPRLRKYMSLESVLVFGVTGLISSTGLLYALKTLPV